MKHKRTFRAEITLESELGDKTFWDKVNDKILGIDWGNDDVVQVKLSTGLEYSTEAPKFVGTLPPREELPILPPVKGDPLFDEKIDPTAGDYASLEMRFVPQWLRSQALNETDPVRAYRISGVANEFEALFYAKKGG